MNDVAYGMNFANTNGDAIHSPTYTTTRKRLQIDLNNSAPLFDVVTLSAGTAFSVNLATVTTDSEQLLVINHNLGYVPQVYTAFLLIPKTSPDSITGTYSIGQMILTAGGASADFIDYSVTTTTFAINHIVQSYGFGSGSYTSIAPNYYVQIKYLICNNPQVQTITLN